MVLKDGLVNNLLKLLKIIRKSFYITSNEEYKETNIFLCPIYILFLNQDRIAYKYVEILHKY